MRISRSQLRRIIREELIRESCAAGEAGNEPCDKPFTIAPSDIHGMGALRDPQEAGTRQIWVDITITLRVRRVPMSQTEE